MPQWELLAVFFIPNRLYLLIPYPSLAPAPPLSPLVTTGLYSKSASLLLFCYSPWFVLFFRLDVGGSSGQGGGGREGRNVRVLSEGPLNVLVPVSLCQSVAQLCICGDPLMGLFISVTHWGLFPYRRSALTSQESLAPNLDPSRCVVYRESLGWQLLCSLVG